jgi:broad specificity phosphatase PhoE
MASAYFITHPEVLIDPAVPVPQWTLSPVGRSRMQALLLQPWVADVRAIWCSTERKAIEGAAIVGEALDIAPRCLAALGENDRSSTGYLPKAEFEAMADAFFASPWDTVRGWERAIDAQNRIGMAIDTIKAATPAAQTVAIVSHGAVGALLLCKLKRQKISRTEDQPGNGGGNYFCFDMDTYSLRHGWRSIEDRGD